jgi:GNAT superfamily N-acetyltransferase
MPIRQSALTCITLSDGRVLQLRAIDRVEPDRVAVSVLLRACTAVDRVRRAGSIGVAAAAERLLPRDDRDVAIGAVGPGGSLVAVANANVTADDGGTFEIAILVAPEWRRRRIAATLLEAAAQRLPRAATATGVVARDDTFALSLLRTVAPTATVSVDPDSVTFCVAVGNALVGKYETDVVSGRSD